MAAALAFGLVIGVLLGLLGAGGSILAVPALVVGVGLPMATAVPASLVVVGASALAGLVPRLRQRSVRWRVALVFGGAGLPAAFVGTAAGRLVPDRWLMLAFALLMVVVAVRMLRSGSQEGGACRTRAGGVDWRSCLPKALAAGAGVGFLTGMFGVGGGFVVVPALTLLLGLTAGEAVSTSLVVVAVNAASGLAAHASAVSGLDYQTIAVFAAAAVAASLAAGRVAGNVPAAPLRRAFAVLVLAVAGGVAAAALTAPGLLTA
ncbi:sulfite exporter TauE/SafE family protein [Streptomonospora sp. PA3]|uniref:sulfite exporter TauE/SafE family protein n=1 Tax=Streptomonospora sp. PA3 TaxID=2607326 RepID=UPI0012DF926D|nr:sulfite exporter TauE/SafE family protein [Streptomonospora sp. PA3]MUL41530.1 sulfite exporter TauE/SafE family protein [Streptomonospora sp. PA3]